MTMIEKVARAIFNNDVKQNPVAAKILYGIDNPTWEFICSENIVKLVSVEYLNRAKAAIEAMRDLVKCDPNGNKEDNDIFNRYIDAALKS